MSNQKLTSLKQAISNNFLKSVWKVLTTYLLWIIIFLFSLFGKCFTFIKEWLATLFLIFLLFYHFCIWPYLAWYNLMSGDVIFTNIWWYLLSQPALANIQFGQLIQMMILVQELSMTIWYDYFAYKYFKSDMIWYFCASYYYH